MANFYDYISNFCNFTKNLNELTNGIFEYASKAVNLSITFFGTMCLWTGIIEIMKQTSLISKIKKIFRPIMKFLFPKINQNDEEYEDISMNIIANFLGNGNAATPLGIKAMKKMQEKNKKKDILTDSMIIFIVLNTASIQLIPTTVIAIRSSLGSSNPTSIIVPVWVATIVAAIVGIISAKILIKLTDKKKEK